MCISYSYLFLNLSRSHTYTQFNSPFPSFFPLYLPCLFYSLFVTLSFSLLPTFFIADWNTKREKEYEIAFISFNCDFLFIYLFSHLLSRSLSHKHTFLLSLTHTNCFTHTHAHSFSLSLSHKHTLSFSLSHTYTQFSLAPFLSHTPRITDRRIKKETKGFLSVIVSLSLSLTQTLSLRFSLPHQGLPTGG